MNARLRRPAFVVVPFFALGLVVGCGTGGGGASATSAASSTRPNAVQVAPAQGVAAAGPAPAQGASGSSQATVVPPGPEGPRVQRSARLVLGVAPGRFDTTLDQIIALVDQAGGYVSGSQAQADEGQLRTGAATFQVPADRLDSVLAEVRKKGTPETISISGNDVSQQYVDLQARLRNAEAQRDAMLALMQQAKTVADTIQIENQLGQVTGQIEQLRGEIDYLDHSTSFATLSVTIREVSGGPTDQWGLQTAASQALHNVVGVLAFLVLVLGTLAPALLLLVAVVAIGLRLWPRLRPSA